jgi:DMSO/TMAO reductase YedYZ molybdopterin-dependent catalytic subunit
LAGLLTARRTVYGHLVFWAMAAVALLAAASRPDFTPISLLPLAVGLVVWTVLLDHLARAAQPRPTVDASRRRFLLNAGGAAVAALLVGASGRLIGQSRRSVETARSLLRLPVGRGAVPAGAATPKVAGMTPWRVSNEDFYRIDTSLVVPAVDPGEWRLRIHGMVEKEFTLTYQELIDRRLTEDWVTICCVSNPVGGDLIGNAWWSGVRIAEVLAEAGVSPRADAVKQTSQDGWTCGTPIEALTDDRNAMLAIAMNGEPLPVEHGFPVRMIVPGLYGYVSATKWLTEIELTRLGDFDSYWVRRGWAKEAPIKTQSRIDTPRSGASLRTGRVPVAGVAWAQTRGIHTVEVRVDDGPWRPARLGAGVGDDTWRQWIYEWDADEGDHTLAVRATDGDGDTQTGEREAPIPSGATGWHTIEVSVGSD